MANLVTIIQNNKLKNSVVFNNFIYHKNNSYSDIDYYKCKEKSCDARFNLMNGQYFSESNRHNHDSHKIEILQQLAINDMRDKVVYAFISLY
jgi:hypothetical protein